jgi:hypothetical protein
VQPKQHFHPATWAFQLLHTRSEALYCTQHAQAVSPQPLWPHLSAACHLAVHLAQCLIHSKLDGHVWHILHQRGQETLEWQHRRRQKRRREK